MSGRFAGHSKEWYFKVFMECVKRIIEVLESLGCADISPEIVSVGAVCLSSLQVKILH